VNVGTETPEKTCIACDKPFTQRGPRQAACHACRRKPQCHDCRKPLPRLANAASRVKSRRGGPAKCRRCSSKVSAPIARAQFIANVQTRTYLQGPPCKRCGKTDRSPPQPGREMGRCVTCARASNLRAKIRRRLWQA
jgi:hypothetical protein